MKRTFYLILMVTILGNVDVNAQNFLLKTSDYIDSPNNFFNNFVKIARQGVMYSASLMNEEFGDNLKLEVLDEASQLTVLFSHKKEPRFPLLRAEGQDGEETILTTKMRVPSRVDIIKYFRETGFVYVTEKQEDGFYVTVFTGSGSSNPIVELGYFDLVIQVLEFPYDEIYIQASISFIKDK